MADNRDILRSYPVRQDLRKRKRPGKFGRPRMGLSGLSQVPQEILERERNASAREQTASRSQQPTREQEGAGADSRNGELIGELAFASA